MSSRGIDMDSFLELEESIAGKPGGRWVNPSNNAILSLLAISLALVCGIFGGMWEVSCLTASSNWWLRLRLKAQVQ